MSKIRQKAELTFKHNLHSGRHGWLRLTPAYSVKLVENLLEANRGASLVLDPFSGTGTTPLCAAAYGRSAVACDINPFLVWLSRLKVHRFPQHVLEECEAVVDEFPEAVLLAEPVSPPLLHNIERWWPPVHLAFLCRAQAVIRSRTRPGSAARDLLNVVFCRTMIRLSNASFNHQSMSFKDRDRRHTRQVTLFDLEPEPVGFFHQDARFVLSTVLDQPRGSAKIIRHDARLPLDRFENCFDLVITSPPYPNRMSYIRELRPYMYWLGYLHQAREAGDMDWKAIGGTWGIATSRLNEWQPEEDTFVPAELTAFLEAIGNTNKPSSLLMARYVEKYFFDMWQHFRNLYGALRRKARLFYVVGNSTFYDVTLPVEIIYKKMMDEVGFVNTSTEIIRKRNSKKELFEFMVSASKA